MRWPVWTPAELDRLRLLWDQGASIRAIAGTIGRSRHAVQTRAQLIGLRSRRTTWTRAEEFRLLELLEAHHHYAAIATALGRTEQAVRDRCAQHLGAAMSRANGRSVTATARLLGVESKTVAWWIREGWLRAVGPGTRMGRGRLRLVEEDDLMAFLADEACWHLWDPARITEPALRDWARAERRGLVFLSTRQAGDRLGLTHYRVNQLVRQGRIRAVRPGDSRRQRRASSGSPSTPTGGNWLIRSDWVVHPPDRRGGPKGRTLGRDDHRIIRRWWGHVPVRWIALRLGLRSDNAVHSAARTLGLPRIGRGHWGRVTVGAGRATGPLGRQAAAPP